MRKCEQARFAAGGEETVSAKNDPAEWGTAEFPPKRNKWLLAGEEVEEEEEEDEEEDLVAFLVRKTPHGSSSSSSQSSESSDSSEESRSSNESHVPVTKEVRQQRIANTRQFYALNRARWLSGDLDDEAWEQFGCDEDSQYLN